MVKKSKRSATIGINQIAKIEESDRALLAEFMIKYRDRFWESKSTYARGRSEIHLKHFVSLSKSQARPLTPFFLKQFDPGILDQVYGVLDKVCNGYGLNMYGGWDSALCLWYASTGDNLPNMNYHRDHTAYQRGAILINVIGKCIFNISHDPNFGAVHQRFLQPGDAIAFDNKMLHKILVTSQERASIVLLRVKSDFIAKPSKGRQLSLF